MGLASAISASLGLPSGRGGSAANRSWYCSHVACTSGAMLAQTSLACTSGAMLAQTSLASSWGGAGPALWPGFWRGGGAMLHMAVSLCASRWIAPCSEGEGQG